MLPTGKAELGVFNGSSYPLVDGLTTLSAGVWYHLCGVLDAAGTLSIYVNGKLDNTAAFSGSPGSDSTALRLGNSFAANRPLAGSLDGASVWIGVGLSAAQVAALYLEGLAGNPNRWRWVEFGGRTVFAPAANFANVWLLKA